MERIVQRISKGLLIPPETSQDTEASTQDASGSSLLVSGMGTQPHMAPKLMEFSGNYEQHRGQVTKAGIAIATVLAAA